MPSLLLLVGCADPEPRRHPAEPPPTHLGLLYRWDPETGLRELLIDIDDPGSVSAWSSVRWGSGRGVWQRDVLYVTDRHRVFGVHVGVPGRRQPVDAAP